jgi:hypothetical protein
MAHSVGEQAARAVKNSERKQVQETRSPEQILKDLRLNVKNRLYIIPTDIELLLGAYDAEKEFSHKLAVENVELKAQKAQLESTKKYGIILTPEEQTEADRVHELLKSE